MGRQHGRSLLGTSEVPSDCKGIWQRRRCTAALPASRAALQRLLRRRPQLRAARLGGGPRGGSLAAYGGQLGRQRCRRRHLLRQRAPSRGVCALMGAQAAQL